MQDKSRNDTLDLNELLHPADAFVHPSEVIDDPELTLNEKRAILASWASDACAVEAAPDLRELPRGRRVSFDDIMDALRSLDENKLETRRRFQKLLRRRAIFDRSEGSSGSGAILS